MPETKEGSYQVANAWWLARKLEIDGLQQPQPQATHNDRLSLRDGRLPFVDGLARGVESAEVGGNPASKMMSGGSAVAESGSDHPDFGESVIDRVGYSQDHGDAARRGGIRRDRHDPVSVDLTVGGQVETYLKLEHDRAEVGDISLSEHEAIRLALEYFRGWMGAGTPIARIDADKWEEYWRHLLKGTESVEYRKKRLRHPRNFIAWLASKGLIPTPPNLLSRKYRFKGAIQAVATMTVQEVRTLVGEAPGRLQLLLLLMVNCGMQQKDISDLLPEEVDWEEGRIVRKRSKTKGEDNVPTVNYKLWPVTWHLLQQYGHQQGDRVLVTQRGGRWLEDRLMNGKRSKSDNIRSKYEHLKRKLKRRKFDVKPMKLLRKSSASLLDGHEVFGRYVGHFLGHSPRSMRDKHYVTPSKERFDEAVEWLGRQYGFVD